ncbi:MAG: type II toxin-antitoxin system VapC family toxin [Flavobacteriales bacterium]
MEVGSIIVDTNTYASFKRGNPFAVDIMKRAREIVFTPVVLGELYSGFNLSKKQKENLSEFNELLKNEKVEMVNINETTSKYYANIYKELKYKGKPIPSNDIWIAASAMEFDFNVFSNDKHFNFINDIRVISEG